jgi:hypothetical protein
MTLQRMMSSRHVYSAIGLLGLMPTRFRCLSVRVCVWKDFIANKIHVGAVGKGSQGGRSGGHDDDEDEMGGGGQRVQCAQQ